MYKVILKKDKIQQQLIDNEKINTALVFDLLKRGKSTLDSIAMMMGLELAQLLMEDEQARLVGPRYVRGAVYGRGGSDPGSIVLGGAKHKIRKKRVKEKLTGKDVALESYRLMQQEGFLDERALQLMLRGLSCRDYEVSLLDELEKQGISKSSVDRKFIKATKKALEELRSRRFDDKEWFAILVDGDQYKKTRIITALGVDIDGNKHPLGIRAGDTENAAVVGELLDELIERGLKIDSKTIFILDGAKALKKAIVARWGNGISIVRCRQHKIRNIQQHLPKSYHGEVQRRMKVALDLSDYTLAKEQLFKVRGWLEKLNPDSAKSLDECFEELLTLHRLGIPSSLRVSLKTTNLIESMFSSTSDMSANVKCWKDPQMCLRWAAAGILTAEKNFRKIRGYNRINEYWNQSNLDTEKVCA